MTQQGRTWTKSVVHEGVWARVFKTDALSEQGGTCAYCFDPLTAKIATADHKKPRSKGGTTEKKNIKAACSPCNFLKGSMTATGFIAWIKNPQPGDDLLVWLTWSRRRINLAARRACQRIAGALA